MFDFNFKFTLEELFGKKVDLLQEGAIDNPYVKASLEKDRVSVYVHNTKAYRYDILKACDAIIDYRSGSSSQR